MKKNVVIPIGVFVVSTLLNIMFHPFAVLVAGVAICIIAALKFRMKKVAEVKLGATLLFRSGLAVIAGVVAAVVFVFIAMSGLLGKQV